MPTPEIRPLAPADAAAYAALRREMLLDTPWAFGSSPADDTRATIPALTESLARPFFAIVGAFDGPRLIGAVGVMRDGKAKSDHRARIWGMYVAPAARTRGIGGRLVAAALDLARVWPGVDSASLSVSARGHAARRLYQRHGFRAWGTEPAALIIDGEPIDEIHMVARLDPVPSHQ